MIAIYVLVSIAAVCLVLLVDSMRRATRIARRRLYVASLRADRAVEDGCWKWLRDQAHRDAIAITLSRHGATSVADLAALLRHAELVSLRAPEESSSERVRLLEVVR